MTDILRERSGTTHLGSPGRAEAPAVEAADDPGPLRRGRSGWRTWYRASLVAGDALAALGASFIGYFFRGSAGSINLLGWLAPYKALAFVSIGFWLVGNLAFGSYKRTFSADQLADYRAPITVGFRTAAVACIGAFALHAALSREVVLIYFPSLIVLSIALRWLARQVLGAARRKGHASVRLLMVGTPAEVRRFANHLSRSNTHGYELVGVCLPAGGETFVYRGGELPVLGRPDWAQSAARAVGADAVAVSNPSGFDELTLQTLAWRLERSGIELLVAPDVGEVVGPRIKVEPVTGLPLLHITEARIDTLMRKSVATMSRLIAIPLTIAILPVLAIVALAVLIDSGRPIFYRQERVGYRQKSFAMLKFRTMVRDADRMIVDLRHRNECDGAMFKMRNDPRVTRVGRFLRRYSLDELPQILNVLKGEMVFVGPRPCLEREMGEFGEAEHRRFMAKPGITGLWQVSGRSDLPWEEAVKLDLFYVENWTPVMDLLVVLRTFRAVLGATGY